MIKMNLQNWERELLEAVAAGQVREIPASEDVSPQSGYTHCACRDCMDTTVSSDTSKPDLCTECTEAGCEPIPFGEPMTNQYECQRDDAYGEC